MVEYYRRKVRSYKELHSILIYLLSGKAEHKQIANREKNIDDAWEIKLPNGLIYIVTSFGVYLVGRE